MPLQVDRQIGAPSDVLELEFCSALQQTNMRMLRPDGRLKPEDVRLLLMSRHGIVVSIETIEQAIMKELSGSQNHPQKVDGEEDDVVKGSYNLDLVQQTSLLLIPELQAIAQGREVMHWIDEEDPKAETNNVEGPRSNDHKTINVVRFVLNILLEQAEVEEGVELTAAVIEKILDSFGESWDRDVIIGMIRHAQETGERSSYVQKAPVLTYESFLNALTLDTSHYDVNSADKATTFYQDAMAAPGEKPLKRIFTASNVDYTADTFGSLAWASLSWFTFAIIFVNYVFGVELPSFDCANHGIKSGFGCRVVTSIILWLVTFAKLSAIGAPYFFLTNLGNSAYSENLSKPVALVFGLLGIAAVAFFTIISFIFAFDGQIYDTTKYEQLDSLYWISLILGCFLIFVQLGQFLRNVVPQDCFPDVIKNFIAIGSPKREKRIKEAAALKMGRMIHNAVTCHNGVGLRIRHDAADVSASMVSSSLGGVSAALYRFHEQSSKKERVGGIWWTWRALIKGSLRREGIWLYPRLVASNCVHWFTLLAIIIIWGYVGEYLQRGDFELPGVSLAMGQFVLSFGAVAGLIAVFSIAVIYIPSAVSTSIKFRAGVLGSLHDKSFLHYRFAQDQVAVLFSSSLWAPLFTAVVVWFVATALIYVLVVPDLREFVSTAFALIIGFFITLFTRQCVLLIIRSTWFAAFYRKRPAHANITMMIMEVWNMALSTGFILIRIVKIMLVSFFYIGRLDTPFMAPGVGWIFDRVPLDSYFVAFRKDLLAHEAHRHPYIERMSSLYLLKLRCGNSFGTQYGAAWRILFTLALMPWMRKYRRHGSRKKLDPTALFTSKNMNEAVSQLKILEMENECQKARIEELEAQNKRLEMQLKMYSQKSSRRTLGLKQITQRFRFKPDDTDEEPFCGILRAEDGVQRVEV